MPIRPIQFAGAAFLNSPFSRTGELLRTAQGKAEALRQAQLAFLHGTAITPGVKTGRSFQTSETPSATQSSLGYAHPYYWAPFVLIGNFQ